MHIASALVSGRPVLSGGTWVLLTDFTPDADLASRLASLGFTTVFLFAAFHFASLAIPPSTA